MGEAAPQRRPTELRRKSTYKMVEGGVFEGGSQAYNALELASDKDAEWR